MDRCPDARQHGKTNPNRVGGPHPNAVDREGQRNPAKTRLTENAAKSRGRAPEKKRAPLADSEASGGLGRVGRLFARHGRLSAHLVRTGRSKTGPCPQSFLQIPICPMPRLPPHAANPTNQREI